MVDVTLNDLVTFALGRTVWPQYFTLWTTTTDRHNTVPIARPLVRSAKNEINIGKQLDVGF